MRTYDICRILKKTSFSSAVAVHSENFQLSRITSTKSGKPKRQKKARSIGSTWRHIRTYQPNDLQPSLLTENVKINVSTLRKTTKKLKKNKNKQNFMTLLGAPNVWSGRFAGRRDKEANRQSISGRKTVALVTLLHPHVSRSNEHSLVIGKAWSGRAVSSNTKQFFTFFLSILIVWITCTRSLVKTDVIDGNRSSTTTWSPKSFQSGSI